VFIFCNVLGGLIGQIKFVGEIFIGLGFPLALISSFLVIFIALVGLLGLGLMFPTISAEGSDAFDAMTSERPYRPAKPKKDAFSELYSFAGRQFDSEIVHAFINSERI